MKTRLDEFNEAQGVVPRPHEREPRGEMGCRHCVFSPGHPVHNHQAEVIDLFSRRRKS